MQGLADFSNDPPEIPDVTAPIVEGGTRTWLTASRFLAGKAFRACCNSYQLPCQQGAVEAFLSNLCTNVKMTDVETCYKAFLGEMIRNMTITRSRFGFEIEVTGKSSENWASPSTRSPFPDHGRTVPAGKKLA